MKKKIFLISLMVVALVFALAISAFAEEIVVSKTESAEYGTIIKLNADPGLDNARQYLSTLKKISDDGKDTTSLCILTDDGTNYYVFPSSYVVNERTDGKFEIYSEALAAAMSEFNTAMKTDYYDAYVMASTDYGNRRMDNIVRFEFPTDVTNVSDSWCCMRKYPKLKEVRIGHAINISGANGLFQNSSALEIVVGFENVTGFDNVQKTFYGCSSLSTVDLPANTTKISSYTFSGCKKLKYTNIGELEYCTTIESNAFRDAESATVVIPDSVTTIGSEAFRSVCKSGGSVTNTPNSKLVTIGANAFNDCRRMTYFYMASTVTSIGDNAFYQCYNLATIENLENCQVTSLGSGVFTSISKLTSIKLPKNLTTLGAAFGGNERLALVYLPDTITSIADTFTGSQPTNTVYIYTGNNVSVLSACARINGASTVKYDFENPDQDFAALAKEKGGCLVVYSYDKCKAFYNNVHNYIIGTGDCMDGVKCERCPSSLKGTTGHTNYEKVTFESLTSNGVRELGCSNEGCTKYDVSETLKPVFTAKGYSTNHDKNAINGGYTVDLTSLALYEEFIGELTYGIVIANANTFGTNSFFDADNKIQSDKALQVEMDKQYSNFDCSINFGANTGAKLDLVICAYVITDDGVVFVQKDTGNDVEIGGVAFKSVTLAQVIALVPAVSKEN